MSKGKQYMIAAVAIFILGGMPTGLAMAYQYMKPPVLETYQGPYPYTIPEQNDCLYLSKCVNL